MYPKIVSVGNHPKGILKRVCKTTGNLKHKYLKNRGGVGITCLLRQVVRDCGSENLPPPCLPLPTKARSPACAMCGQIILSEIVTGITSPVPETYIHHRKGIPYIFL